MNKVAKKLSRFQSKVEIARTGDPSGIFFDYLLGSTLWDIHVFDTIVKMISEDREAFMQPVSNDVNMETHFIITGSNASGNSRVYV